MFARTLSSDPSVIKNSDTETFQWSGQQYAENSDPQEKRNLAALQELEPGLSDDDTVLDVGCGSGGTSRIMAGLTKEVIGIDNSDSMLEKAKIIDDTENLSFEKADARDFKFDKKFSVITSFFCLQWIPKEDLYKTYKNINNHLKDDGRICILLPCYDFPHEVIKGMAKTEKWEHWFEGFKDAQTFENREFYLFLLQNTDFSDLEVTIIQSEHLLTDDEFIEYTRQWCGCYQWLENDEVRNDFINDIQDRLKQETHDDSNHFTMTQQSLRIFGTRGKQTFLCDSVENNSLNFT